MGNTRNWRSRWQDGLELNGTGHAQQGSTPTEMGRERARLGQVPHFHLLMQFKKMATNSLPSDTRKLVSCCFLPILVSQNWSILVSTGSNLQGLRRKEYCIWIRRENTSRHTIKVNIGAAFWVYLLFCASCDPGNFCWGKGLSLPLRRKWGLANYFIILLILCLFHAFVDLYKVYIYLSISSIYSLILLSS